MVSKSTSMVEDSLHRSYDRMKQRAANRGIWWAKRGNYKVTVMKIQELMIFIIGQVSLVMDGTDTVIGQNQ